MGKAGEVLHLHFQIGVRVQEGLLQAEIQKEEEEALQVQFQVEVRVEPFLPQVQVRLSENGERVDDYKLPKTLEEFALETKV